MADIAELGFKVDSKPIAQARDELGRFVKAAEQTTAATEKLEKQAVRLEKQWKQTGKMIGLGIAALGGAAMGLYIKNTIEAEKVQAQLASRIKDTGGAAQRSMQQLNDMADKLQGMTIFDDEAIGSAQAMLLTFKNISGVNFDAATAATLDLATAMGTDATAAALQLGKALNDPILGVTALGRSGVQFSESQKAMIKSLVETGDKAGAQRIILKELEGQMGTAAEAARNTLGGALQALKNSFDNLLEGDSGSDGVRGARDAIESLNTTLNDPDIKRGVDDMVSGLVKIANTAVQTISMLADFSRSVKDAFAPDSEKTYMGLLEKRAKLEEKLNATENNWTTRMGAKMGLNDGGKAQREQLAALDAMILKQMQLENYVSKSPGNGRRYRPGSGEGLRAPADIDPTSPTGGGGSASAASNKAAEEAIRQAEEAARALRDAQEAQHGWHERVLDMQASLEGPTAEALREYQKQMTDLDGEFAKGKITLADYAIAQDLVTQQRDKDVAAINARKTPAEEMLESLQLETEELYLSNDELEIRNRLLTAGVSAQSVMGKQISDSTRLLQEQREAMGDQIEIMDSVRDAGKGLIEDVGNGVKPIDAIADAWERVRQKLLAMAAEQLMDKIFGKQGDPAGGGSGGGWLDAAMGILGGIFGGSSGASSASMTSGDFGMFNPNMGGFGGPRALGGDVRNDRMYQVGERNRPELLNMGGKQYLIPGDQGNVEPVRNRQRDRKSGNTIINIGVEGQVSRSTRGQIGTDVARSVRESTRNN